MRQLLSDPDNAAAIAAIALPLDDCVAHLQTSVAQIMHGSSSSSRGDAMQAADPSSTAAPDLGRLDPRSGVSGDLQDLHLNLGQLNPVDHTAAAAAGVAIGSSKEAAGVVKYVGVAVLHEEQLREQLLELMGRLQQQQQQQHILPTRIKVFCLAAVCKSQRTVECLFRVICFVHTMFCCTLVYGFAATTYFPACR